MNVEYPQNKINIYQMKLKLQQKKKQKNSLMSSMYSSGQGSS